MNRKKTYSYDIFDTCIGRYCHSPSDLYELLALKVIENPTKSKCKDFAICRINAEKKARSQSLLQDITLDEIYLYCNFSHLTNYSKEKIKKLELSIESSIYYPILENYKEIKHIHEAGDQVIFISDMYLPSAFLKDQLKSFGFWEEGDKIYVSGEKSLSKIKGDLFKLIKDELSIDEKQWIHTGDNLIADYRIPKALGIKSRLYKQQITYYQKSLKEFNFFPISNANQKLLSIQNGLYKSKNKNPFNLVAIDLIAPLYVSFTDLILHECYKEDIKDIYFLARDSFILYEIANILHSKYKNLNLHYLYVSRKSLYIPGLKDLKKESIIDILTPMEEKDINAVCDRLGLDTKEFSTYSHLKGNNLIDELYKNDLFHSKLLAEITKQKAEAVSYLKQEGLLQSGRKAIVDLIGSRKCQRAINSIITENGGEPTKAFYLQVVENRIKEDSDYVSYVYSEECKTSSFFKYFERGQNILEQYFSISPQNRTASYRTVNGVSEPIFEKDSNSNTFKNEIYAYNRDICISFAQQYLINGLDNNPKDIINIAIHISTSFFRLPRKEYLKAFYLLKISDYKDESIPLIEKLSIKKILKREYSTSLTFSLIYTYGNIFAYLINILYKLRKYEVFRFIKKSIFYRFKRL